MIFNAKFSGFTIVRNPITRFISGYYTANWLLWKGNYTEKILKKYPYIKFIKKEKEPFRFRQFVDDLIENPYEFTIINPLFHIMSQSAVLTVAELDLHFILRFEHLTEHFKELTTYCDILKPLENEVWPKRMGNYGREYKPKDILIYNEYKKIMSLDSYNKNDIEPAWFAMNEETYNKIVEYYKQDYKCFNYKHDYKMDVLSKTHS